MRILTIFGTRPEAIKMAPVVNALANDNRFESKVCVTAQHREMLDQVLTLFNITPDFDLDIMKEEQDITETMCSVLQGLKAVFALFKPDYVLIHGDTSTTISATLAAYYQQIKVAHVEAGLRTGNIYSPWPEEGNRKIVSVIADLHFAPTEAAKQNLQKENIADKKIIVTGNTVIDSLLDVVTKLKNNENLVAQMAEKFKFIKNKPLVLITGHRRENFGDGFKRICEAIVVLANKYPEVAFVYPLHLNPKVREPVNRLLIGIDNVFIINPLDYLEFVFLMDRSKILLTDSGGIQEEAPSLGKPVLVMRETTERPEAIEAGTVKLVGTDVNTIVTETANLLNDKACYEKMSFSHNPYGDGSAVKHILNALLHRQAEV